ncbi:hypothetical protein D3C73_1225420 [compost metagenome]
MPLSLEAADQRIVPVRLLRKAQLSQLRIADHEIAGNQRHFYASLPLLRLFIIANLQMRRVIIRSGPAILLDPRERLRILLLVINPFLEPADKFRHIHVLIAHAQILLEELLVYD